MTPKVWFAQFGWLLGSRLLTVTISFASTAILVRLLNAADFGYIVAGTILLTLCGTIFEGVLGVEIVRREVVTDEYLAECFGAAIFVALCLMLLVDLLAFPLDSFLGFPGLWKVIVATSPSIVFVALLIVSNNLLQRRQQFRLIAINSVVGIFVGSIVCSVPLAILGFGVWSLVAGYLVSNLLETMLSLRLARVRPQLKYSYKTLQTSLRELSWHLAVAQVLNWSALSAANLIIGRALGPSSLGMYSRGWRMFEIVVSATASPLRRVFLPVFAAAKGDHRIASEAFMRALNLMIPSFSLLSTLVVLHADFAVRLLLGVKWLEAIIVVQFLFAALLPRCLYKLCEAGLVAFGFYRPTAYRQAVYALMMIVGVLIGVRYGEMVGVAAAVSIVTWLFYLISIWSVVTYLRAPALAIIGLHAKAVVWVIWLTTANWLSESAATGLSFWAFHSATLFGTLAAALMLVLTFPNFLLGADGSKIRRRLIGF